MPVIDYRPPVVRATKSKKGMTAQELRQDYEAEGIVGSVADAIQNIIRSEKIDYDVSPCRIVLVFADILFS